MMLKLVFAFFIIFSAAYLYFSFDDKPLESISSPSPTPSSDSKLEEYIKTANININDNEYVAYWLVPSSTSEISLIPNFDKKTISKNFLSESKCSLVVNAGFYTKENTPAGYFKSDNKLLRAWQRNSLFNGIFYQDKNGLSIIFGEPPSNAYWGVQTGPILIKDSIAQKLKLNNDKYARRSVGIITKDKKLSFLIIFNKSSGFSGPRLGDMPEILDILNKNENIKILDAINLDGGTASAFLTQNLSITEAMPVGSFFCIKL